MSIRVKGVSKFYGSQKVVDDISFSVSSGSIVGFLGPNGAGKSTTMKMITTYIPVSEGEIEVCDMDTDKNPIEVKRNTGYLPEHNPLYQEMYVREYLQYSGKLYGLKNVAKKAEEMINIIGLDSEKHKKIGQLSKCYRQRVGLAQALLHDPNVLILDEPTSGLDPNQILEIRELIKRMGATKTVLLSTHILQEVIAICDRIIIINKGKLVADTPVSALNHLASGRIRYSASFSEKVNRQDLASTLGNVEIEEQGPATYAIISTERIDIREKIFKYAVDHQVSLLSLSEEKDSLEDIFRKLTTPKQN